jgi:hypothetical protein
VSEHSPGSADPRAAHRTGPDEVVPDLHADAPRPGTPPADADPGSEPMSGTSEQLDPVQGLHVPEIDEDAPIAPGRHRADGPGPDAVRRATDDAP